MFCCQRILTELDGVESTEEMHFFYDAQSKPAFIEYDGVKYCYIHSLQWDVVAIVDATEKAVVEYRYEMIYISFCAVILIMGIRQMKTKETCRSGVWFPFFRGSVLRRNCFAS